METLLCTGLPRRAEHHGTTGGDSGEEFTNRRCSGRISKDCRNSEGEEVFMTMDITSISEKLAQIKQETAKVIIGQNEALDLALVAILTGHHALVEGVPGVGKTLLVRTLAAVLGVEF